jgi:hypothetical protein
VRLERYLATRFLYKEGLMRRPQLRALKPVPALSYVPLIVTGDQRPSGARQRSARRLHALVGGALRDP